MDINESPLYVLLNPSINHAQKDLPITIFESGTVIYIFYCCVDVHGILYSRRVGLHDHNLHLTVIYSNYIPSQSHLL